MSGLEHIDLGSLAHPQRLREDVPFVAAVWVISPRTVWSRDPDLAPEIRHASDVCLAFKAGDTSMADRLVAAMVDQIAAADWSFEPDTVVVPVPLSPHKRDRGDLDRAGVLADGVADALGLSVRRWVSLTGPISKREMKNAETPDHRFSRADFEQRYGELLSVSGDAAGRVLLVDDVCGHGSTLDTVADALSTCHVVGAVTAGQVALTEAMVEREPMNDNTPDLTENEMIEILKAIARDGRNGAARIAAIKELRSIRRGEKPAEDTVQGLYEVNNPGRVRSRAA